MFTGVSQFAALAMADVFVIGGVAVTILAALVMSLVVFHYGAPWIQAYMPGADVSVMSLIGMSFRQVKPSMIVTTKIMGRQAGLNIDRQLGMSTARLEAAQTHMELMETPDRISKSVLARGLDANTAFEIVSIDIADIDVGDNIGARLRSDQAEADTRTARARAEARRAEAIACQQEMKAKVTQSRA